MRGSRGRAVGSARSVRRGPIHDPMPRHGRPVVAPSGLEAEVATAEGLGRHLWIELVWARVDGPRHGQQARIVGLALPEYAAKLASRVLLSSSAPLMLWTSRSASAPSADQGVVVSGDASRVQVLAADPVGEVLLPFEDDHLKALACARRRRMHPVLLDVAQPPGRHHQRRSLADAGARHL